MGKVIYELPGGTNQRLRLFEDHFDIVSTDKAATVSMHNIEKGPKNIDAEDWADMEFYYSDVTKLQTSDSSFIISVGDKTIRFEFPVLHKDYDLIEKAAEYFKRKVRESQNLQTGSIPSFSFADELLKYKSLLNAGAITAEEYAIKKEELLNLTSELITQISQTQVDHSETDTLHNTKSIPKQVSVDQKPNEDTSVREKRIKKNKGQKKTIKKPLLITLFLILIVVLLGFFVLPSFLSHDQDTDRKPMNELRNEILETLRSSSPRVYTGVRTYDGGYGCVPDYLDDLDLDGYGIYYDAYPVLQMIVDYSNVQINLQEDDSHKLSASLTINQPELIFYELDLNEETVYLFDASDPYDWKIDARKSLKDYGLQEDVKNDLLNSLMIGAKDISRVEYYTNSKQNIMSNYCMYDKEFSDTGDHEDDAFLASLFSDIRNVSIRDGYELEKIRVSFRKANIVTTNNQTPSPASDKVLFKVKIKIDTLRIRTSPGIRDDNKYGANVEMNRIYDVYETASKDGYTWYRIGTDMWIADNGVWTERVDDKNENENSSSIINNGSNNNSNQNTPNISDNSNEEYQWCLEEAQNLADNYFSKQSIINDISRYPIGIVNKVMQNISVNYKENCKNTLLLYTSLEGVMGDDCYREQLVSDLFTDEEIRYAFRYAGIDWEARATTYIEGFKSFEFTKAEITEMLKELSYSNDTIKTFSFDKICLLQSQYISRIPKDLAKKLKELRYKSSNIDYVRSHIDFNAVAEERVNNLIEYYDGRIYNSQITDSEIQKTLVNDGFEEKYVNHGMEYLESLRNKVSSD